MNTILLDLSEHSAQNTHLLCTLDEARLRATAARDWTLEEKTEREETYSHERHKYLTFSTAMFVLIEYFRSGLYNCSRITSCHVETNHWTLRCFWQRLMKQDSWLAGFGRPAHTLSVSVCVWAPGLVLVHSTVLFLKPLPHFREHC